MAKFYELMAPTVHVNPWSKDVYRVRTEAAAGTYRDMYLHNNGKIKWGTIDIMGNLSHADFPSLDKAHLALNDYYVKHGYNAPFVRVGGAWRPIGAINNGQTSAPVVDSSVKSEPMSF